MSVLHCADRRLDLSRPKVMGILNVTPDSFSDGGRFVGRQAALDHAGAMVEAGASLIDVGGESTRPGAQAVAEQQELDRVLPIIEALQPLGAVISVDTMKPAVMQAAIAAGAQLINDVNALRAPGALDLVAKSDVAVCLMHMQGEPRTMQQQPSYGDVTTEVHAFLEARLQACSAAGVSRDRLLIDPGFGFGKQLEHNLQLLVDLPQFTQLGVGLLVGLSRKSMFGQMLDLPTDQRVLPSVVAAVLAVQRGAAIVRVHDVRETMQALRLLEAVDSSRANAAGDTEIQ